MSNKTILQRLIVKIDEYNRHKNDISSLSKELIITIEALENIPYSIHLQLRDWLYQIDTEASFYDEGFESKIDVVIANLKKWLQQIMQDYS